MGAAFTWRAVNITTQQPLIIPNTTVSSGSNTSVLILRPIRVSDHVLVNFFCGVGFPEFENKFENNIPSLVNIRGKLQILETTCLVHRNQFYSFLACCIKKYYILFKLSHDNPTVFIFERYI